MALLIEGLVRFCKRFVSAEKAISPPSPHYYPENFILRFPTPNLESCMVTTLC
jgi:hypothetical protein